MLYNICGVIVLTNRRFVAIESPAYNGCVWHFAIIRL
jgi:hypothetical protein